MNLRRICADVPQQFGMRCVTISGIIAFIALLCCFINESFKVIREPTPSDEEEEEEQNGGGGTAGGGGAGSQRHHPRPDQASLMSLIGLHKVISELGDEIVDVNKFAY